MEHRWGSGWTVGWRVTAGAVVALALVAPAGAAFADDPLPAVPTPAGTIVAGDTPDGDGLVIAFNGSEVAPGLPAVGVVLDQGPVGPGAPAPQVDPGLPPAGAGARGLVTHLVPLLLGTPAAVLPAVSALTPVNVAPPACAAGDACGMLALAAPGGSRPAPLSRGDLVSLAPAMDAVALALGTPRTDDGTGVPPGPATPARAGLAPASDPPSAGPALASTGSPIVAALAGLVLLAVGGFLTCARARG